MGDDQQADSELQSIELKIKELTRQKLDEELRELRRPWFARPSALPAYTTVSVALVGGFLAFGTDLLKSNIMALKRENEIQARQQEQLQNQIADLTTSRDHLGNQIKEFESQRTNLEEEIKLSSFRGLMDVSRANPTIDSLNTEKLLTSLVQSSPNRPQYAKLLADIALSPKEPMGARGISLYVLHTAYLTKRNG